MVFLEFWKFIFSNIWIFLGSFTLIITFIAIVVGGLVAIIKPIQGKHIHHHHYGTTKMEIPDESGGKEKSEEKGWEIK